MKPLTTCPSPCASCPESGARVDADRRDVLNWFGKGMGLASGVALGMSSSTAWALDTSTTGLQLVDADAEGPFKPLHPEDLGMAKPLLVFPFDPKAGTLMNQSRLNKLVLIRLDETQMSPETRDRSASGVLAYSGICTHQGCDVKTWFAKENVLACFCHSSKFALLDGAKVVGGPAPKPLPSVALKLEEGFLTIAPKSL